MNTARSLLTIFSLLFLSLKCISLNPDAGLSINELVHKYGYPLESHDVQTEDGYILTLHRIPYGIKSVSNQKRPPVLLMHSFLTTSMSFLNKGANASIGFVLADAGYDVWLGNQRGNTFGRRHVSIDPDLDSERFFNFTLNEIGVYDVTAKIDYILTTTKQDQLSYIGHSQGCGVFFIMTSERPEYNQKVNLMISLAPAVFVKHNKSPVVRLLANSMQLIKFFTEINRIYEFLRFSKTLEAISDTFCSEGSIFQELCAFSIFIIAGFDSPQLDRNFIPVITSSAPAGSSIWQLYQFLQWIKSGNFSQYDHGVEKNLEVYGQPYAKLYNLKRTTVPIVIRAGLNDWLVPPIDAETLVQQLPNVDFRLVPYEKFNHLDFIWANDVKQLVNDEVVEVLRSRL